VIDLSDIVNDEDIACPFSIIRTSGGTWVTGGIWQPGPPVTIPAFGPVRNATGKELQQLPESDRVTEALTFRSTTQMFVTNLAGAQTSDVLVYQEDQYRVLRVKNYSDQGVWYAMAARMAGN
jgi:hypothetical protein